MCWRISTYILLLLSLCCSKANSQEAISRPTSATPARLPPAGRQAAPPRGNLTAQPKPATARHAITPRRETAGINRQPAKTPYSVWRMLEALILVVAGIFGAAKFFKSLGVGPFNPVGKIPNSVCEILGVTTIPHRHTLYLMRFGQRVLLVGSTGERLTVLSEIHEASEVASISQLCSASASREANADSFFGRLLNHAASSPNPDGPPIASETNARQELEDRLNAFAQS